MPVRIDPDPIPWFVDEAAIPDSSVLLESRVADAQARPSKAPHRRGRGRSSLVARPGRGLFHPQTGLTISPGGHIFRAPSLGMGRKPPAPPVREGGLVAFFRKLLAPADPTPVGSPTVRGAPYDRADSVRQGLLDPPLVARTPRTHRQPALPTTLVDSEWMTGTPEDPQPILEGLGAEPDEGWLPIPPSVKRKMASLGNRAMETVQKLGEAGKTPHEYERLQFQAIRELGDLKDYVRSQLSDGKAIHPEAIPAMDFYARLNQEIGTQYQARVPLPADRVSYWDRVWGGILQDLGEAGKAVIGEGAKAFGRGLGNLAVYAAAGISVLYFGPRVLKQMQKGRR